MDIINKTHVIIKDILEFVESFAPPLSASDWDNVGLQVGDTEKTVKNVFLSLDISPEVIKESLEHQAELIITHHPMIFRGIKKIDYKTPIGIMISLLIENSITLYSAHTNLDKSPEGTGVELAHRLGLSHIKPLSSEPGDEKAFIITGILEPPGKLAESVAFIKKELEIPFVKLTSAGEADNKPIRKCTILPGSGGSLLNIIPPDTDLIITGEVSYHDALESRMKGKTLLQLGHFNSEKPVIYRLQRLLQQKFPQINFIVSTREGEPYSII